MFNTGQGARDWKAHAEPGLKTLSSSTYPDHDEPPTLLAKRIPPIPFVDNAYKQAKKKGENLLCALKDPSHAGAGATSPWNSIEQLSGWGWMREVDGRDDEKDYSHVVRAVSLAC